MLRAISSSVTLHLPSMGSERGHRNLGLQRTAIGLLIVATGLLLSLPLVRFGHARLAHDAFQDLSWYEQFSNQFWSGDPYPRWIMGMNLGLGSPIFFCYGPAAFFVPTLLRPIFTHVFVGRRELIEFDFSFTLVLIGSGFSAYLWLKKMTNRWVALVSAILYMAAPYHLIGDVHFRYAAAECLTFVAMPLLMYFSIELRRGNPLATVGWAASYALLISSHLLTTLIFSPVPALYFLFLPESQPRRKLVVRLAIAVALGIGLSAIYLLPALAHQQNIPTQRLTAEPFNYYENNFVRFDRASLVQGLETRSFNWYTSLFVLMTGPIIVCGLLLSLAGNNKHRKRETIFWASVGAASIFMMLPWSLPVWRLLPPLQQIWFPWRFNTLLTLAATASAAVGIFALSWPLKVRQAIWAAIGLLVLVSWTIPIAKLPRIYGSQKRLPDDEVQLIRMGGDNLRRVWARWTDQTLLTYEGMAELVQSFPSAKAVDAKGLVSVSDWKPRRIHLQVSSPDGTWVVLRQFYYPGWSARVVGGGQLTVQPSTPEGLIRFWVPGGNHEVLVWLNGGVMEKIGRWISTATLLTCLVLIVSGKTNLPGAFGKQR